MAATVWDFNLHTYVDALTAHGTYTNIIRETALRLREKSLATLENQTHVSIVSGFLVLRFSNRATLSAILWQLLHPLP